MPAVVNDLASWFWRLVPANPILVRVVLAGGRRMRHLWIRAGYLSALAVAVVIGVILTAGRGDNVSLADLAKRATQMFENISILQLFMVCVMAPIFTAAAITQEKDSQTYSILLSTPLTNGQIVLGSLLSRLYFVVVLLLAGVPLFCIMMVYGGVTGDKIALSSALAVGTATLTGSLAIAISVVKIGTGRTVFSFCLAIAIYLITVFVLAGWNGVIPAESVPAPGETQRMSWLAPFHPFLALWVVLGRTPAPDFGAVAHYGFPRAHWLAWPEYSYFVMTMAASLVLVIFSMFFVRRCTKEGEPTLVNRLFSRSPASEGGESTQTRKPRHVGRNPVAWREAATGASAAGGRLSRYAILITGLLLAFVVLVSYWQGKLTVADTRNWLCGIVAVELSIALFIATTTAATSMTREKESNTLQLLLATPITSSAIIAGKIWGLVRLAIPMLAVPYVTVVMFVLFDLVSGRTFRNPGPAVHVEALLTLPVLFIAYAAVCCMIGLRYSIAQTRTFAAVFYSMIVVIAAAGCTVLCASVGISGDPNLAAAFTPFSPIYAVFAAVDPSATLSDGATPLTGGQLQAARIIFVIAAAAAAAVYGGFGYAMHRGMVVNFDMTIRKQTA